jgi:hypothetical protein
MPLVTPPCITRSHFFVTAFHEFRSINGERAGVFGMLLLICGGEDPDATHASWDFFRYEGKCFAFNISS